VLVEHTLTHQGAFYDYLELDAGADDDLLYDFMTTTFVDYLWLMAPPGSMWNYSNPNFYLAGLLTEQVSGQYYREYMDAQVFTPLGMDRTFFLGEEVLADGDYASGDTYNWTTGIGRAVAAPDSYDNAWGRPAGFAWSSVLDMAAFARFLLDGDPTVLSDALRQEMMSPQVDVQYGIPLDYGYGLFINEGFFIGEDWYDLTLVSHGGDIPGFAADMYFIPELNAGFVALASTDYAHLGESAVAALELIGLPEPGTAPEISVDTATFPDFAGEYMDPWNVGPMTVTTDGSSVIIEMPLLDDYGISYEPELYPYTPDNFLITVDGYTLVMTFLRDDGGDVQYARTRPFVLEVVDEAAPPPPPSSLALDTDRLRASLEAAASADARQLRWVPPERVGVRAARR
jgi:CubicO group peptidase (beta-lactamase class C family)